MDRMSGNKTPHRSCRDISKFRPDAWGENVKPILGGGGSQLLGEKCAKNLIEFHYWYRDRERDGRERGRDRLSWYS